MRGSILLKNPARAFGASPFFTKSDFYLPLNREEAPLDAEQDCKL